jgi:hypothetical protein
MRKDGVDWSTPRQGARSFFKCGASGRLALALGYPSRARDNTWISNRPTGGATVGVTAKQVAHDLPSIAQEPVVHRRGG